MNKYTIKDYDNLIQYILDNGELKKNRTGIDTLSIFGAQMRFDISNQFPIATKRKVFPKSVFAELIWMLSGSTNVNDLEKLGCKFWSPWRNEEFELKNNYIDGEFGPIYGWQLRHFGADYKFREDFENYKLNYKSDDSYGAWFAYEERKKSMGFDQVSYIVDQLKNNKTSRRILFSLWNPPDVNSDSVILPPCHYSFILNVDNNDNLSGMLVQRSMDIVAGGWANIIWYSAFIYMLAQQCNLKPKELIVSVGDCHVYSNQINAAKEYLSRPEIAQPTLKINQAKDIFSYKVEDFVLENYNPLDKIEIPVAV